MTSIIRNVRDIDESDREALEHVVGGQLQENQQVIINVVNLDVSEEAAPTAEKEAEVPAWWNIYEGLSDEEIDRLDAAIRQRANLTRVFE